MIGNIQTNSFKYNEADVDQYHLDMQITKMFNAIKSSPNRYFKAYLKTDQEFDILRIKCRLENWNITKTPDFLLGNLIEIDKLK